RRNPTRAYRGSDGVSSRASLTVSMRISTEPESASRISMESGICLAGGAGQLKGLDQRLQDEVNINSYVADDAMTCVARGAGRVLEDYNNLRRLLVGIERGSTRH
ncbi:MAG: rod shape-determining protein, partial [Chloroflexota bacterium]